MMNHACGIDVYALQAAVILGDSVEDFTYERPFHTAHAGRRAERAYEHSPETLLSELGDTLVVINPIPAAFAATNGEYDVPAAPPPPSAVARRHPGGPTATMTTGNLTCMYACDQRIAR